MFRTSKIIHDNVWGDIEVSPLAIKIIDTPEFQRLHYIKQTGCAYHVFPTAKTSRFEHSIGTYHVTGVLLSHLLKHQPHLQRDLPFDTETIKIAALLHDIGHGPFSHCFDMAFPSWHHEKRSQEIAKMILGRLEMLESEILFVCDLINPDTINTKWYTQLVKNKVHGIDVDKLDYMPRDIKALGLTSDINVNRIITSTRVVDDQLCFCERIKDDLFSVFFTRYRLHKEVYSHPKILEFDVLITKIIQSTVKTSEHDIQGFCYWNDMTLLMDCPDKDLTRRFLERRSGLKRTTDVHSEVYVRIRPGFCSEGVDTHPLSLIKLYDRKDPMKTFCLKPEQYNMLAIGPSSEEVTYQYTRE